MSDTCAICLDDLQENTAIMPGCNHKFHVRCLINACQYDVRCAVCRSIGDGVVQRKNQTESQFIDIEDMHQQIMNQWRRYSRRRRKVFKENPNLHQKYISLKKIRSEMTLLVNKMQKEYDEKCKQIWKHDASILEERKKLANMRRKELRIERCLKSALEDVIGPEP